jgi:hypothetical protein
MSFFAASNCAHLSATAIVRRAILIVCLLGLFAVAARTSRADTELFKVTASDGAMGDNFGTTVDVSGFQAIISSPQDDENGSVSGSAYIFNATNGVEIAKLLPTDGAANARFGYSVAISGNRAIAGAFQSINDFAVTGSAYIFQASSGNQLAKLVAMDAQSGDEFGKAVDIDGIRAIVGAPGDDDGGFLAGSAYVFDAESGGELYKIVPADSTNFNTFGKSVAIAGGYALVGALDSVYVYNAASGTLLYKLSGDGSNQGYGETVALSGSHAIIGARGDDDLGNNTGAAYVYDLQTGVELYKLTASDASPMDEFGRRVAISGDFAIVGAPEFDGAGAASGKAYVYDLSTGAEVLQFFASDAAANDLFGFGVGISGQTIVVGAYGDNDHGTASGSAYFTVIPEPSALSTVLLGAVSTLACSRRRRTRGR